jgi:hypothetical protein
MNTCDDCVREHAPDLLAAVDHLCKAGWRGIDDERVTHLLPFEGLTLDQIKAATRELIDIGHVSHTHAPGCTRCDAGEDNYLCHGCGHWRNEIWDYSHGYYRTDCRLAIGHWRQAEAEMFG